MAWEPKVGDKVKLKDVYKNNPAYSIKPEFKLIPYFVVIAVEDDTVPRKVINAQLAVPWDHGINRWIDMQYFEPYEG